MIREIKVNEIGPHPNNPREELGDLTELTDSIRSFGIMQNLTVVPNGKTEIYNYTVIIGHRRLAAAKAAGLETVPCKIADMDESLQIETMLMENMQRSDLTPLEEAKGFQMMLDLGASIADICTKTGLSETKVRHRVKLNELDEEVLREKLVEQISINDLIRLEQVHDIDKRNELLKKIGTNNFNWEIQRAVEEQKEKQILEDILSSIPDETKPKIIVTGTWKYKLIFALSIKEHTSEALNKFKELVRETASAEPCYIYASYGSISLYIEEEEKQEEVDPAEEERKAREAERKEQLTSIYKAMTASWTKFIGDVEEKTIHENESYIETEFLKKLLFGSGSRNTNAFFYEGLGEEYESTDATKAIIEKNSFHKIILANLISSMIPYDWQSPVAYNGKYDKDGGRKVSNLLSFIEGFGYKVSDEEKAVADGTHELYKKED